VFLPSIVSPFGVYLARIYAASSMPNELLEAARLDGAGEIRTFFFVAACLMVPALMTIYLFQFVATWHNFFLPLVMLQKQALYPVTLGLYNVAQLDQQAPELQHFWQSGLAAGGVK